MKGRRSKRTNDSWEKEDSWRNGSLDIMDGIPKALALRNVSIAGMLAIVEKEDVTLAEIKTLSGKKGTFH